ncbi:hypothetical protein EBR66_05535 [bacterium]|nr:hypothetical protein [bacterium]
MANQGHGFLWETVIKETVFQNMQQYPYTAPFDIPACDNRFNTVENISIKTCGKDTCGLGDARRIFQYKEYPMVTVICVGYTQQNDLEKTITKVQEISLSGEQAHALLFKDVTEEDVNGLLSRIKAVPKGVPRDHPSRKAVHEEKKRLNAKSGLIRLNPKMDSKHQRRLQCSIPKLSKVLLEHPEILLYSSTEPLVRGIRIPSTIQSPRRVRNGAIDLEQM